jgi:hypothetical protein
MIDKAERERIANCSICRCLSDVEFVDHIWTTDVLPDAAHKLETVATLGWYYPLLQQCPECGTYYTYYRDCGYMEDDESLKRLSDGEGQNLFGAGNQRSGIERQDQE